MGTVWSILKSIFFCLYCRRNNSAEYEEKEEEERHLLTNDSLQTDYEKNWQSLNYMEHAEYNISQGINSSLETTSNEVNNIQSSKTKGVLAVPETKSQGNLIQTPVFCNKLTQSTNTNCRNERKNPTAKVKRAKSLPSNTSVSSAGASSHYQSQEEDCFEYYPRKDSGDLQYWNSQRSHHNLGPPLVTPIHSGDYIAVNAPLWKRLEELNTPMDERPPVFQ